MSLNNSNGTSRDQLMTIEDLNKFKDDLLSEIKRLLEGSKQHERKQWLRSAEVRRMLGISAGTLQNFRVNGILPYSKVSGIVFYRYEEIMKLLERNRRSPFVDHG